MSERSRQEFPGLISSLLTRSGFGWNWLHRLVSKFKMGKWGAGLGLHWYCYCSCFQTGIVSHSWFSIHNLKLKKVKLLMCELTDSPTALCCLLLVVLCYSFVSLSLTLAYKSQYFLEFVDVIELYLKTAVWWHNVEDKKNSIIPSLSNSVWVRAELSWQKLCQGSADKLTLNLRNNYDLLQTLWWQYQTESKLLPL